VKIEDRHIGPNHPPYVIAEIGVNHDGHVERAIELVHAAREAGADAIKLQYYRTDLLLSRASQLAAYQKRAGAADPFTMLRALELDATQLGRIVEVARSVGVHAILSVFNEQLVASAKAMSLSALKVASPDIINTPLLKAMAATGLPMIVSTGTADACEVIEAAEVLRHVTDLAFLHCVSAYPTPPEAAQLAGIAAMADLAARGAIGRSVALGYSDHTQRLDTGALAVAAGARILEKHLTYDRTAAGPDHEASIEPDALRSYIEQVRTAWSMMGPRRKSVSDVEREVRLKSRQSVVAARDLPTGHTLGLEDLAIKRPGTGLSPKLRDHLVGRTLARDVAADTPLVPEDLSEPAP
jgi:N,N'-diacetyllegionaminate synthase